MGPQAILVSIAAAGLPLAGATQPQLVEVPLPLRQDVVRRLVAPPGDFIELCTSLKAGRALAWQFEATMPLAFNTHVHLDGGVRFAETMSAVTAARGHLVPSADHAYCWLWTNLNGSPVTVRIRLSP